MQLKTRWLEVGLMLCLSAPAFGAEGVDAAAPQGEAQSKGEAQERGPVEISLMGGLTILAEAGEDDPLGLIAFPFGGVYNAPLRGSYWLTDTLALQITAGNRVLGYVAKEGEFYRTHDGSASVSAGIQLSPQPQTQLLSPYLGLSLGTFYIRDGNKRGVNPFASLETGARLKLNDHAALRGQVALKPLIGPDNLGIYTTELGLGLSIFL